MKKTLLTLTLPAALISGTAMADSSYVTGNAQLHSDGIHGSNATSTLEAGHTFDNTYGGFTAYAEIDGIQLGTIQTGDDSPGQVGAGLTVGGEQSFNLSDKLWVAAGYQHLMSLGKTVQYRPLVKIGYNFDNGIALSNRTRAHIDATDTNNDMDLRMDNRIGYDVTDMDLTLSYNNVYVIAGDTEAGASRDNTMDHELRATWTRSGVQPYFEYRNQSDNNNNAFVFGASYGF
ncbi:oligogalacturonate-specific porin KdgM family protein [Vibrio sp. Of7-15]|uniref:oligogalacturonate-specific porin KdgM family protein n=1 Tax=Vibrio sp. Of7-15 TaxID=2724879 RepID=UPI001EF18EED|nr:oligogalacturonate-specific porin KdgM family protein [Vibrio sp. Of7-15]MCG7499543.1 oligogalacturonate-specific porin KdgM family protein [Vibrio sp. Of7-15]